MELCIRDLCGVVGAWNLAYSFFLGRGVWGLGIFFYDIPTDLFLYLFGLYYSRKPVQDINR